MKTYVLVGRMGYEDHWVVAGSNSKDLIKKMQKELDTHWNGEGPWQAQYMVETIPYVNTLPSAIKTMKAEKGSR